MQTVTHDLDNATGLPTTTLDATKRAQTISPAFHGAMW